MNNPLKSISFTTPINFWNPYKLRMPSPSNITGNKLLKKKWFPDKEKIKMTIMRDIHISKLNQKNKTFWEKSKKKMLLYPNTACLIKAAFFILTINMIKLKIWSTFQPYHKLVHVFLLSTILKLFTTYLIIMNTQHLGTLQETLLHYLQKMLWQLKGTKLWFVRLLNQDNCYGRIWIFRLRETLCLKCFLWWWWLVWWH